jgi:hypothetical protein
MEIKKLDVYNQDPGASVNNEYKTSQHAFRQPCLHYIVGTRSMGKSFLTSKILAQAKREKTFDKIYIVTPSFNSNAAYFDKYIDKTEVYEPTRESISMVIKRVEDDRDEWEQFLADKIKYEEFKKDMKRKQSNITDENMVYYYDRGFFDSPPTWKYPIEEPPKSLLILDDVIADTNLRISPSLKKVFVRGRHIGISIICTSQNLTSLSPLERNNSDFILTGQLNVEYIRILLASLLAIHVLFLASNGGPGKRLIYRCCSPQSPETGTHGPSSDHVLVFTHCNGQTDVAQDCVDAGLIQSKPPH